MNIKRFITLSLFFLPSLAFAAAMPYNLLAPIAGVTTVTSLKDYLLLVFRAMIGITGVLAVVMIVICGIKLMGTPSVSGKSEAKQCIWNAIFGVILVIGSWILLNTINPQLLQNDVTIADTTSAPTVAPGASGGGITDPMPTQPGWYYQYKDANGNYRYKAAGTSAEMCTKITDDAQKAGTTITKVCFEIRQTPQPAGEAATRNAICGNTSCIGSTPVGINRGACSFCGQKSCTNVDGLPGGTISAIQSLQSSSGIPLVITGGTECGHTTHAPGMPIFDLGKNTGLLIFVKNNSTIKDNPSFSTNGVRFRKWLYNGYWYTDEGDHLHVCKDGTTWSGGPANKNAAIQRACNKM